MTDRREIATVLAALEDAVRDVPPAEVPALVARLGGVLAIAAAHLAVPTIASAVESIDRLLNIADAAKRTGMSKDWLYRHASEFPFTRRIGRKLLFSEDGLARWIATRGR